MVTRPRNAESEIDEGLVGVLILAPTFLRVDVAAGKVARREVKRVSSPNCVHMRFTFTLYYFMLPLLLPLLLLQRTRKCAVQTVGNSLVQFYRRYRTVFYFRAV